MPGMDTEVRTVTLPGRQVRSAKLKVWAEAEGVRIVENIRRLESEPGTFTVMVRVQKVRGT